MNGLPSSSSAAIAKSSHSLGELSHGYTAALGCYNHYLERDRDTSPPPDRLAAAHQVAQISCWILARAPPWRPFKLERRNSIHGHASS
jgi:hypothetical protein